MLVQILLYSNLEKKKGTAAPPQEGGRQDRTTESGGENSTRGEEKQHSKEGQGEGEEQHQQIGGKRKHHHRRGESSPTQKDWNVGPPKAAPPTESPNSIALTGRRRGEGGGVERGVREFAAETHIKTVDTIFRFFAFVDVVCACVQLFFFLFCFAFSFCDFFWVLENLCGHHTKMVKRKQHNPHGRGECSTTQK